MLAQRPAQRLPGRELTTSNCRCSCEAPGVPAGGQGLPVAPQTIMPSLLHRRGRDKLGPWGPLSNAAALGAACSPGWADGCARSEPRRFRDSIATATATPPLVSSGAARGRLSQEPGVGELPSRACAELQRWSPGRGGVLGGAAGAARPSTARAPGRCALSRPPPLRGRGRRQQLLASVARDSQ